MKFRLAFWSIVLGTIGLIGCSSVHSELSGARQSIADAQKSNAATIENIDSASEKVATSQPAESVLSDLSKAKANAVATDQHLGVADKKVEKADAKNQKTEAKLSFYKKVVFWTVWFPLICAAIGTVGWFVFTEGNLPGWITKLFSIFKRRK